MAELAIAAMAAGVILQTIGQVQAGRAAAAQGKATQALYEHRAQLQEKQAKALEQEAGQERARSQRVAAEEARQGRFIRSRARAVGAASGAALDPTIFGDLDTEIDYRVKSQLASGEERGRGLEFRADVARSGAASDVFAGSAAAAAGKAKRQQANLAAAGTILSGGGGLYDKYRTYYG